MVQGANSSRLNAFRGVAVLMVIFLHLPPLEGMPWLLEKVRTKGDLGVQMFFVLSGYLVGGSVLRQQSQSRFSWRGYLRRRYLRIAPVFFLGLILYHTSPTRWAYGDPWTALPLQLLLMHDLHPSTINATFPSWTLAIEMSFYLLIPLLTPSLSSPSRGAFAWIAAVALGLLAQRLLFVIVGPTPDSTTRIFTYFWLPAHLPCFLGGTLVHLIDSCSPPPPPWRLASLGGGLLLWVVVIFEPNAGLGLSFNSSLAFSAILLGINGGSSTPGFHWLAAIGTWSLSCYVIQFWVIEAWQSFFIQKPRLPLGHGLLHYLAMVSLILGISFLMVRWIERHPLFLSRTTGGRGDDMGSSPRG